MPTPRNLMPIGRFAASVRLSVKALRHYDELGLLAPAFVDASTGYRYYAPTQARAAVLIGMLRELELPLASIQRALCAKPAELRGLLVAEAEGVERELVQRERALRSLQHLARAGSLTPYEISLYEAAPLRVARRTLETTVDRLVPESSAAIYTLLADLRRAGWKEEGPILCENEDPEEDGRQVVHVCATVGPKQEIAGADLIELPGGAFARLLHTGPFETLGLAYHALHAFAQERGHERRGPMREIYVNDPADVAPEAIETEVWMPV
jgi:DNA-binding transcriptional MerR regulator